MKLFLRSFILNIRNIFLKFGYFTFKDGRDDGQSLVEANRGGYIYEDVIYLLALAWSIIPNGVGFTTSWIDYGGWRFFIAVCALPSFIAFIFMPESPKYFLQISKELTMGSGEADAPISNSKKLSLDSKEEEKSNCFKHCYTFPLDLSMALFFAGVSVFFFWATDNLITVFVTSCIYSMFAGIVTCMIDVVVIEVYRTKMQSTAFGFMCGAMRILAVVANVTFGALIEENCTLVVFWIAIFRRSGYN